MNKLVKYLLLLSLSIGGLSLFSGNSGKQNYYVPELEVNFQAPPQDTTIARFPVKKTYVTTYEDLDDKPPIDLRDPSNVKSEIEYDIKNNIYLFKTKIGDQEWATPFSMTPEEYSNYSLKESMSSYFRLKNSEIFEKGSADEDFNLKDIKINIGPAEKIFGPGGIKIRPQGYAEFSMGINRNTRDNPSLSERNRSHTMFKVDQKINVNVAASVGDKVNFDLNYNTEAAFDFDSKKLKLAYEGKEDEIIRYLEAGNVSFNTSNSLITGASSLFGLRADLQFGKLKVNTVISQQESESKSVGSKGGVQTLPFEFKADKYDENRHFLLGFYFRDNYDRAMRTLPSVNSTVVINKIEVWVTNKRGNFEQARNIVAFADLGEGSKEHIHNTIWEPLGNNPLPGNKNNTLYNRITTQYPTARDIGRVTALFNEIPLVNGLDYEKVENARLLNTTEYSYNSQLGYLSLNVSLQTDDVIAVAYSYTIGENTYQVGEFSSDVTDKYLGDGKSGALFLKLLKPVSLSPVSPSWDLMMKNIYSLGVSNLSSDKFRLNISYQNDTTGTYINYMPEGNDKIKDKPFLYIMNLDRLDSRQNRRPDGIFDYVEGYTVRSSNGRIIFPVLEPFGSHLREMINDNTLADKYVYQELYDTTLVAAQQVAEKNKFRIDGTYKASNNNELSLGATNVARGSVRVTAGGVLLTEGVDYTVDYIAGTVEIINTSITDAGTPVNVSLENQSLFNMQKKTLLGLNLSYDFTKDFNIGATFMHMYEKPLITKTEIGGESVKNTLLGFNLSYRTESQWLTNLIDKLPFVNATQPSQITFNGEFAKMFAGHYQNDYGGGYSYLDDFETSRSRISLRDPYGWVLSSVPSVILEEPGARKDSVFSGVNRAHLAWFRIESLFTRKNSSLTPSHIKNDKPQLSNHFVREVRVSELYPNRDAAYNETSTLPVLNLSYYPTQRGAYNLDDVNINRDGTLMNPKSRWGGIARKIDGSKDFEAQNIEYIEFWLLDPFVYNHNPAPDGEGDEYKNDGGTLVFNLGEISEDILMDGKKFFESGLPVNGDMSQVETSAWGKVPKLQVGEYAFNREKDEESLRLQDVGLNGLSTAEELVFPTYSNYLQNLSTRLSPEAIAQFENDPFSPFNDPAGDNYHYYRGSDYDREEKSILDRYKYYNGTEGNSLGGEQNAAKLSPDVEDINQDYTLNETEAYFEYKVPLYPDKMDIGDNEFITNIREVSVSLPNGETENVKWYQFKIPIREKGVKRGNISDFKSIRYMRMYLTGFEQNTYLRFATLELVRGDWRTYTQSLQKEPDGPTGGTLNVTSVNIEENGDKQPVNYILPPGESRILDPSQPQLRQENEQSLSLQVLNLDPGDAKAVYKNTGYDLRRYKRIQMFVHAESVESEKALKRGDITVFMRLGSDYKNNYYEYEIPVSITPPGSYHGNSNADRLAVWPAENMFDFQLELLKNVKLNRNREKRKANSRVSYTTLYDEWDPEKPNNRISVIGNPSLSEVSVIMIGIRNISREVQAGEIWVNELRLTDFDEEGGWAAQGNLNVAFSDIGSVNVTGRKETIGFGSIDQSLMERRADDYSTYSIQTNVDLGRFLPEKVQAVIPLYYTYSNETLTPKYDPLDQDVTLDESLAIAGSKAEKDEIKSLAQTKTVTTSLSLSGVKMNIRSKTPMPYDPANFSFGYSQNKSETKNPTTVYDRTQDYKLSFSYNYSPMQKTWKPFENIKSKAPMSKFAKNLGFNYVPNNIAFNSYITLFYTETSLRDIENYVLGNTQNPFESSSQDFYWDRDFALSWDFTKNLKFSINTGTKADLNEYEPYNPNEDPYGKGKKDINKSIKNLRRLAYQQTAKLTYNLPLNDIPFLDWINSSATYDSQYTWDRGARIPKVDENGNEIGEEESQGNVITNRMQLSFNNRLNMVNLYNKSSFLKKVNQKFGQTMRTTATPARPQREERRRRKFEQEISLNLDSATIVRHGLNTKNLEITARRVDNNRIYNVKVKKTDNNTIKINNKDTVQLKLVVIQGRDREETTWYKIAQYAARGLMSVRTIQINYSRTDESHIYGYNREIGNFFGQNSVIEPGLGFAFGLDGGEDYLDKSIKNNRIVARDNNITPSVFGLRERLDVKMQLEPFRGLKIDLSAVREKDDRTNVQVYPGNSTVRTLGGSFSMSIISISSAFESVKADNDYYSKSFEKFLANRDIIAERIASKYSTFGREKVSVNSSDVLIPAFLATYTNKDPKKISLSPFPALSALVPNWTITYEGLTTLPWFKDNFKNFKIMHGYNSTYRVGAYSSYTSWRMYEGLGFIEDPISSNSSYLASSPYDISSVTIDERFNPLLGVEGTLNNGMTLKARYNSGRMLNLNIASYQIVESRNSEFVIGFEYRINDFNRVIGLGSRGQAGFNNDLRVAADLSHRSTHALLRKIEERLSQATTGTTTTTIKLSADYALSRALTLRAYFDRVLNKPLISASSYPTTDTDFGLSIRFTLTQ